MPTRQQMLRKLRSCEGEVWLDTSGGYGSNCSPYRLDSDGLSQGGSFDASIEEIPPLTKEEIAEIRRQIAAGEYDRDDPAVWVVQQGGKANTVYYCADRYGSGDSRPEVFPTRAEAQEAFYSDMEFEHIQDWEDMDDAELEEWCQVVGWIKQGFESADDLPSTGAKNTNSATKPKTSRDARSTPRTPSYSSATGDKKKRERHRSRP